MRWFLAMVVGCGGGSGTVPAGPGGGTPTDTGTGPTGPAWDCATDVPALPLQVADRIGGFTGAEDFAFDDQGRYVATDSYGNLLRITYDGDVEVWVPNLGETAGTAFLPDGTLAIANVSRGQVQRVRKNGSTQTLIAGLSYPNGLAVDGAGRVYVADQNLGEVYRYDPDTDTLDVLATGLFNPNGLALGPGHTDLYVGSFGGATVHRIDLLTGDLSLFGETPVPTTAPGGSCDGLGEGDECFLDTLGLGACDAAGQCALSLDYGACAGRAEGAPCQTDTLGATNDSVCVPDATGALFCPEVPADVVVACMGKAEGDPCSALGQSRDCATNWEGVLVCDITPWYQTTVEACSGLSLGDDCLILDFEAYAAGECVTDYYGAGLVCDPFGGGGYGGYIFHGGLDGIGVDACGYVWVTEYTLGYLWRFPPEGGAPELAAETGTFWIPNLHWGNGVGGWDEHAMYIQDRFTDELLVVPVGLPAAAP